MLGTQTFAALLVSLALAGCASGGMAPPPVLSPAPVHDDQSATHEHGGGDGGGGSGM